MTTVSRIVVATDFSGCADAALALAVDVVRRTGACLEIMHVCESGTTTRDCLGANHPLARAWRAAVAESGDAASVQLAWDDVGAVARTVWSDDATGSILDRAAEDDVDLLVMGTHGHHSVRRFLNDTPDGWPIGQTARVVLPEARCPVLVVGPQGSRSPVVIRQVVAPVDDSRHAELLVEQSSWVARFYRTPLVLLHVLPRGSSEAQRIGARRRLTDLVVAHVPRGQEVEIELTEGRPADAIVRDASRRDHPLVILASHGNRGRGAVQIGSVADAVTRSAPCPVLTVKPWGKALGQFTMESEPKNRAARAAHT